MDIKLFKGFTPFVNTAASPVEFNRFRLDKLGTIMDTHCSGDPTPSQWRHVGFQAFSESDDNVDYIRDLTGAGYLCGIAFNERNLPGAVIKEALLKKAARLQEIDGRKVGKKQFAELREEVILELLPKAFIKRKVVPVMFVKNFVMVFSTSAKVCDDVTIMLNHAFGDDKIFRMSPMETMVEDIIGDRLTTIARDGQTDDSLNEDERIPNLTIYNLAVLKGEEKETITIKDKDIGSTDIQTLLVQDYHVTKLGVKMWAPGEDEAQVSFVLNDKLVLAKFAVLESIERNNGDDEANVFDSYAWLVAKTAYNTLDCLVGVMGGLRQIERNTDDPGKTTADEDDDEI